MGKMLTLRVQQDLKQEKSLAPLAQSLPQCCPVWSIILVDSGSNDHPV
jgi:hypothetical protein